MNAADELYYSLLNSDDNVSYVDIEKIVYKKMKELGTTKGTSKDFALAIGEELNKLNVTNMIINTNELMNGFEHIFILCELKETDYYVIDPTFRQFNSDKFFNNKFGVLPAEYLRNTEIGKDIVKDLLLQGLTKVDNEKYKTYLHAFNPDFDLSKLDLSMNIFFNE